MESNIIKFTSITEGESSYSIELSMPFIGISVDEDNIPVSQLTYVCNISVIKGVTKMLPSSTPTTGAYTIQLITTSFPGLRNIVADNVNGRVSFTTDIQNALSNGEIQFNVLLENSGNAVMKTVAFSALQGLQGSDGLTYSFDYDNGQVYKFKNGNLYEYTPKTFRIAGYRRQGVEAREKLTNTDCYMSATVSINGIEISMPVSWDATNRVFFISFADSTQLTVNGHTDYITQYNIRKLTVTMHSIDGTVLDRLVQDVNYGTSDDAASLVLNPTSIIGAIQNTKIGFTTDGLDIFRGGLRIFRGTNDQSEKVFEADENGNLKVRGSIENGSAMAGWTIKEHTMISGSGIVGIGDGNSQSPAGDYSFWAGNEDPSQAPFSVKKTGEMKATLLEIGGTQITQGTIRTGAFAPGAVDNNALAQNAVDSANIRQGAVITDHLYANSVTVDKLAADVGQSLDLSSNISINLLAGDLRDDIEYVKENAYGQRMTMHFADGNAFEYGKTNLEISVQVWKNGKDITSSLPASAFQWQRETDNYTSDVQWNQRSDHRGVTSIVLPRDEITKSCVIRCICDDLGMYPIGCFIDNGSLYMEVVDVDTADTFSVDNGCLYVDSDSYEIIDGCLYADTSKNYMQVESTAFDHSLLQSSHISIKDDKIDVVSGGSINMLAGSDINIGSTADINIAAGGNMNVANGGHLLVASGGDITVSSGGKLRIRAADIVLSSGTLDSELSGLDSRLGTAEVAIRPDNIISTVRSSTSYQSDISNATTSANTYTDGKLKNYSTTSETSSMIDQKSDQITSSVSKTYATITYADTKSSTAETNAKGYADTKAGTAEKNAKNYTDGKLVAYSTTEETKSLIDQEADKITTSVSKTYATIETVDGQITKLDERLDAAEQKITPTAITTTVRSSTSYKNDLGDIEGKADNAQKTANTAKNTADTAKSTADTAKKATDDHEKRLVDAESEINQTSTTIKAVVTEYTDGKGNKVKAANNVKTSSVTITSDGIAINSTGSLSLTGASLNINSSGSVNIESGGTFTVKSGGTVKIESGKAKGSISFGDGNFSVTEEGKLNANSGVFGALTVGGNSVLTTYYLTKRIIVSETQPSGSGIIWINPKASSSTSYTTKSVDFSAATPGSRTWNVTMGCSTTLVGYEGSISSTPITYTISIPLYQTYNTSTVKFNNVTIGGSITFPQQEVTLSAWGSTTLTMSTTSYTNLTGGSIGLSIKGSGSGSGVGNMFVQSNSSITLTCSGTSGTTTYSDACVVKYIQ